MPECRGFFNLHVVVKIHRVNDEGVPINNRGDEPSVLFHKLQNRRTVLGKCSPPFVEKLPEVLSAHPVAQKKRCNKRLKVVLDNGCLDADVLAVNVGGLVPDIHRGRYNVEKRLPASEGIIGTGDVLGVDIGNNLLHRLVH